MQANEILQELFKKNDISYHKVSALTGVGVSTVARVLTKNRDITTGVMNRYLNLVGYKLIAVPKETTLQDGWLEVENLKTELKPNTKK